MSDSESWEKQIRWVLRISRMNAWTVTFISALFTLGSLVSLSLVGTAVGAAVMTAGFMEMRGHKRLEAEEEGAQEWMAGSQAWLLVCVFAYCGWRVLSLDPANPFAALGEGETIVALGQLMGLPQEVLYELFVQAYYLTYASVAVLALIFQGSLGLYYWVKVGRLMGSEVEE